MARNPTVEGEQRRAAILAAVDRDAVVRLGALAEQLGASEMTIRRDLGQLELLGHLRRVRGGAVAIERPQRFDERRAKRPRAKLAIARKAAELVPPSGAVAFDASSTVGALSAHLPPTPGLTIVTNSVENYTALRSAHVGSAILTGGEGESSTGSLVGPLACASAQAMVYEAFFLSSTGLHLEQGATEVSLLESQVKQFMARQSHLVHLCLDSSKLGGRGMAVSLRCCEIDTLITELDPSDPQLAPFRGHMDIR